MMRANALIWVLVAAVAASGGCDRRKTGDAAAAASTPVAAVKVPLKLDSATVIGASVSAGAEVALPGLPPKMMGGDATLADVLAAITSGPAPTNHADIMFFSHTSQAAEKQLEAVKAERPRVLFAIDYLFWHAYGGPMTDEARRAQFERGLKRLESIECPIVIADLPDMSHAIGSMLAKFQVPSAEMLAELNARLDSWAAGRPNVTLVRLREAVANAMANKPTTLGGHEFEGAESRALLVKNGLHTSADGLICVGLECLMKLQASGAIPADRVWETDVAVIRQRLVDVKLAAIEARKAKAATGGR